jgi:hypothetical protein
MSRFFDRGAITAAWVGVGMAVTIGVSFLLVIPIEAIYTGIIAPGFPVAWLAGLTIGYYANGRSNRHGGPWGRILANALLAGAATAVTFALLFLGVKALFFAADNGYPDYNRLDEKNRPIPPYCASGANCVFARYVALQPDALAAAGITNADEFSAFYWTQQLNTALGLVIATVVASAAGGVVFRLTNSTKPATSVPGGARAA